MNTSTRSVVQPGEAPGQAHGVLAPNVPPEQVRGVMEANVTTVLDNVDATDGAALVLTEASLLAEYSQLSQLGRWTDLTAPPRRPVVLVTGRAKDAPGQPDQVDGRPLPITSDSQLVSV